MRRERPPAVLAAAGLVLDELNAELEELSAIAAQAGASHSCQAALSRVQEVETSLPYFAH